MHEYTENQNFAYGGLWGIVIGAAIGGPVGALVGACGGLSFGGAVNSIHASTHNANGCRYYHLKDYQNALLEFKRANEKDSGPACRNIGLFYEHGHGDIVINFVTAARYYQQAMEKRCDNYYPAQNDLERLFSKEEISGYDLDQIGVMYGNADGVKKDYGKAFRWHTKAIAKGNLAAYRNIGVLYENGLNFATATEYYRQAIDKGYQTAQNDLERLFSKVRENLMKEACDRQANEYCQSFEVVKWAIALFDPSYLVQKIGNSLLLPAIDWVAEQTETPALSTGIRLAVEGSSFIANPVSYTVRRTSNYILNNAVDSMELTDPVAKAALMLVADAASTYAGKAVYNCVSNRPTTATDHSSVQTEPPVNQPSDNNVSRSEANKEDNSKNRHCFFNARPNVSPQSVSQPAEAFSHVQLRQGHLRNEPSSELNNVSFVPPIYIPFPPPRPPKFDDYDKWPKHVPEPHIERRHDDHKEKPSEDKKNKKESHKRTYFASHTEDLPSYRM